MLSASTKSLIGYLARTTGYRTAQTRPASATAATKCLVVTRVGTDQSGTQLHDIDRPAFTVRCFAPTIGEATDMADAVSAAMDRYRFEPHVTSCTEYSAYDDSGPNGPEYKLAYKITYR